jgi:hypothetical protein
MRQARTWLAKMHFREWATFFYLPAVNLGIETKGCGTVNKHQRRGRSAQKQLCVKNAERHAMRRRESCNLFQLAGGVNFSTSHFGDLHYSRGL